MELRKGEVRNVQAVQEWTEALREKCREAQYCPNMARLAITGLFAEKLEAVIEKFSDYVEVMSDPDLMIGSGVVSILMGMEHGPEVAYYLGCNPEEAERISALSTVWAALELGRIEAGLIHSDMVIDYEIEGDDKSAPEFSDDLGAKHSRKIRQGRAQRNHFRRFLNIEG